MPSRNSQIIRRGIVRSLSRERNRLRLGLLSTIRGAAPVDTGELRASIRAGSGETLVTVDAPHWYWNEIGVPHPGNKRNRGWLSNAVRRFERRNKITGTSIST